MTTAPTTIMVPDDLKELSQWVLWRYVHDTKVPHQIDGRRASSTNPDTWTDFESVEAALQAHPDYWSGVGFVFHESDPYCGVDLDDCLTDEGELKAWARGIVQRFADTYMEVSPSYHGIKIWTRGSLPANLGKVPCGDGGVEMYSHSRYFTFTGRVFREAPLQIEDHQDDLLRLHENLTAGKRGWLHQPEDDGRIPYGVQHSTLVSIAGSLRRRHVCHEAILNCLLTVNRLQCERPGPEENIERIVLSTERWL